MVVYVTLQTFFFTLIKQFTQISYPKHERQNFVSSSFGQEIYKMYQLNQFNVHLLKYKPKVELVTFSSSSFGHEITVEQSRFPYNKNIKNLRFRNKIFRSTFS